MPPNGPDEWRARIGHWENRKLRWYQAHCGSRPRVPLYICLERAISAEAFLMSILLLLSLTEKVAIGVCKEGNGVLSSLGSLARFVCGRLGKMWATSRYFSLFKLVCKTRCGRLGKLWATSLLFTLFLALSLLLVVAGDVETNPGPISGELLVQVDDSELTGDDLHDVYEEVYTLAARWSDMCLALKLPISCQEMIEANHRGDSARCLQTVLVKWLQKDYNHNRHGPPTWRSLVKAVDNPAGGNNCALAEAVAKKHLVANKTTPAEISYSTKYVSESQCSGDSLLETQSISDDEEWDPPTEFADMLALVTELLDNSVNIKRLKHFLTFLSHPRTQKRYIDVKLYGHCNTPGEIIEVLHPRYINFMHTHLLRRIVNKFGDQQSKTLLKQYEDNFPRNKPLKRIRHPILDEEAEACLGTKRIKVKYDGDVDTTTMEDVERVRQAISRKTEIDECMIVYTNQIPGSVIFTYFIPETVVDTFSDLNVDSQEDLADHGIVTIMVDELFINLQSSKPETKTHTSTYTASGMKRIPLCHDLPKTTHCNSEFQQLIFEVGASIEGSVETSKLKEFLQGFNHILYPEAQYIDPRLLKDAESVPQIFTALQPQIINFLNWGVLWKVVDTFDIKLMSTVQSYTGRFPPHTKLATLPDPLSEKESIEFRGFQKLRVTCGGNGIEWTLGDVQVLRETLEKATGIDQDFIIYAYWEGGFTTRQLTFLIPKSISGIFGELCEEDLTILVSNGVQKLEVDYDTVANNIQEVSKDLLQARAPVKEENEVRTKSFGLEHFIPEDEAERMSKEEFSYLNDLITSIPGGKLQETCSNDFLKVFAKKMGSWKDLAPYLGINQWDLEDLAEMYPRDEEEQKYVALLNWKSIDVTSATYERLLECLLTHGHVNDAVKLLLQFQGTEVQKAQAILQQRFLKDPLSKKKLWSGAPKISKFNRKFGIVQKDSMLSKVDYTSCYETIDQFRPKIQVISMKSMLNKITQKESRVFIFKGPPGCGKTELISRVCRHWAKYYALREFSLVLYVNIWDLHQGSTLQNIIDRQFTGSTVFREKVCHWIEEEKGNGILFILDGFCHTYLLRSPLSKVNVLYSILSGSVNFSKSTVLIATSCSDFVKPLPANFIQFDILGLSDEQIGRQVIQHLDEKRAVDFLTYLAENPEIASLVLSPIFLIGNMYICAHVSYDDLPVTWTELYTSLIAIVNEWHKGEFKEGIGTISLQSQLKNSLFENSRKVVENSGDLLATIGKSLIHEAEECDHELLDHNSAVPYLQYFLFSLETLFNPNHKKLDKALKNNAFAYFWYFLAGHGVETDSNKLLKQYYKTNVKRMANCFSESASMTAKEKENLSSKTAEFGFTIVTTRDIHSILHCLPYMQDPYRVVFNETILGTQATEQFSRFLAADSWSRDYSGIKHLCLKDISVETISTIAMALKTNHSLQILNLERVSPKAISVIAEVLKANHSLQTLNLRRNDLSSTGAVTLAKALQHNKSLKELNLESNRIGSDGATALADALRVNQSLKILNLEYNRLTSTGAVALAKVLQETTLLEELNLEWNDVGDAGATALADALRVNQNLKRLGLRDNGLTSTGAIALARALQQNRSLETLNFNFNRIGDDGATALGTALRVSKSLKTLSLRDNGLTSTGAIALAKALQQKRSLEELNLGKNKIEDKGITALAVAMRVNQSLKTLDLELNRIGDKGATALADALRVNHSLKTLNLRDNDLTSTGAVALARALQQNKSLEELNLELNKTRDGGATVLAGAMRWNHSLKILGLRDSGLTDTGAIALAEALLRNRSLEVLNLAGNVISDDGAIALASVVGVSQSLKALELGGLQEIKESTKKRLQDNKRIIVWFL